MVESPMAPGLSDGAADRLAGRRGASIKEFKEFDFIDAP